MNDKQKRWMKLVVMPIILEWRLFWSFLCLFFWMVCSSRRAPALEGCGMLTLQESHLCTYLSSFGSLGTCTMKGALQIHAHLYDTCLIEMSSEFSCTLGIFEEKGRVFKAKRCTSQQSSFCPTLQPHLFPSNVNIRLVNGS